MRSSHSRAVPVSTRETRIRHAGLSGARAISRLLVALIESLGQHDKAGRRPGADWPHGTVRSAFGPTPLGAEIERVMAPPPRQPAPPPASRDAVTGLPLREPEPRPIPFAAAFAPMPCPAAQPRPPRAEPPQAAPPQASPPQASPTTAAAPRPAFPPIDPVAATPMWRVPFQAAPGVRYVRTPDHLLRCARGGEPISPIEPETTGRSEDELLDEDHAIVRDETFVLDDDPLNTDFIDEVEALNTEDHRLPWTPAPARSAA